MKAYIKPDSENSEALWLVVSRGEDAEALAEGVEALKGTTRDEDSKEDVAYPLLKDEVEAIMRACKEYLEANNE